uniref:Uncharacterized protein n=1 Tax=Lepeophtheirus salmonis TaxID=72036 RepID=A0A0K2TG54_LEPSM
MFKSVLDKYNDVIAMVPQSRIDSKVIKKWFFKVLKLVTDAMLRLVAV